MALLDTSQIGTILIRNLWCSHSRPYSNCAMGKAYIECHLVVCVALRVKAATVVIVFCLCNFIIIGELKLPHILTVHEGMYKHMLYYVTM